MYTNPQLWELTLDQWPAAVWELLESAANGFDEPFRTPAVASTGPDGPDIRTVILREVHSPQRRALFYTDARSPKVEQMASHNAVTWMFYDPARRLQVRARGTASLHGDDLLAKRCWEDCSEANRRNYGGLQVPGSALEELSKEVSMGAPDGRENFLVVATAFSRLDVLLLGDQSNRRAGLAWDGSIWTAGWLSP
jgi:pyridoxamine 5'-phosphate oxidase